MEISQGRPFYIFVSNVSEREFRLPERMIIANKVAPSKVIYAGNSNNQNVLLIGTSQAIVSPSNELHLNGLPDTKHVSAVHYEPTDDKKLQMLQNAIIKDDISKWLAQDWR